jgi:hypothetical protein
MKYLSRRSFVWRAGRILFGIAGASVYSRIGITYAANPPTGDGGTDRAGTSCGNAGYECSGSCATLGAVALNWVRCCYVHMNWQCCTYTDHCASADSIGIASCRGSFEMSQPQWCGNAASAYVCTSIGCSGSYGTYSECASACTGNQYGTLKR